MRLHPADRKAALLATIIALHIGALLLLMRPLLMEQAQTTEPLVVVNIAIPQPPPAPEAETSGTPEPEAAAAPPAPRARPKPVSAPPPPLAPQPTPADVAPTPSSGPDVQAGAAISGVGTGRQGTGSGIGAGGTGTGGGGKVGARWKSGQIDRRDYPADVARTGQGGQVTVHLRISPEGRVTDCTVARTSGIPSLDTTTCRLILQRFRYEPARDAAGNAVPDLVGWRQDWWLEPPGR